MWVERERERERERLYREGEKERERDCMGESEIECVHALTCACEIRCTTTLIVCLCHNTHS